MDVMKVAFIFILSGLFTSLLIYGAGGEWEQKAKSIEEQATKSSLTFWDFITILKDVVLCYPRTLMELPYPLNYIGTVLSIIGSLAVAYAGYRAFLALLGRVIGG